MPKVLLVDDNLDMLDTLEHLFHFYEFDVVRATNGKEALVVSERELPDLILLDALMPVMNGFDACKELKANPKTREIPVIFLSANYVEDEHRILGLELGADDYILKPFNAKELITRVKTILQRKQRIEELRKENENLVHQQKDYHKELQALRKKATKLEKSQITDSLTGLYNAQYFKKRLDEEFHRAKRYQHDLSIVLIDVDFFKKINERYGRQTGDYILMKIANIILNNTRFSDVAFRLDGNKFAIILPSTLVEGAFKEAERVREAIEKTPLLDQEFLKPQKMPKKPSQLRITASTGVASLFPRFESAKKLLNQAEKSLQKAKEMGRNISVKYTDI